MGEKRAGVPFYLIVGLGFVARGIAATKSAWLDELHTTELAAEPTLGAMMEILLPDFHAPLYYLALRPLAALDLFFMRMASIVVSMLGVWPLWAMAKEARLDRVAQLTIVATYALAPFQIRYGAELRPYAWLGPLTLLMSWAALTSSAPSRRRFIVFALVAAVGLYTHYLASVSILALGAVRLFIHGRGVLRLDKLILAGVLGVVAFVPWVLYDESWLLEDPGAINRNEAVVEADEEVPDDPRHAFSYHREQIVQLLPQLLVPGLGSLGGWAVPVGRTGFALVALAAMTGLLALVVRPRRMASTFRPTLAAAFVALVTIALVLLMCVKLWERIAIQYFMGGAWVWAPFLGAGVHAMTGRYRQGVVAALFLGLALLATAEVTGAPREDLARAVAVAREEAQQRDGVVTALMRQPPQYDHDEIFRIYAPDLDVTAPEDIPRGGRADAPATVVVILRRTDPRRGPWPEDLATIRAGRELERVIDIDEAIKVAVYRRRS